MNIGEVYNRIHLWRKENIKERHFLLFTCFIVGILTALAAYLLKLAIHFIELFLTNNFSQTGANYLYLVYPIIGILLAGLFVKVLGKGRYQPRRYKDPLLHLTTEKPNQATQHLYFTDGKFHHNRFWRIGRGRSAYRIDGIGHRFERGALFQARSA